MKQSPNSGIIVDIHHICILSLVSGNKAKGGEKQKDKRIACMKGLFIF